MTEPGTAGTPSVAICIPTFNQADHLPFAVRSAYAQTYPGPIRVHVLDDASTDGTADVLAGLVREFPDLDVRRQPSNRGIARNASDALRSAEADLVVRLDSDDVLEPGMVAALVPQLMSCDGAGYAHSAVTDIDERGAVMGVRSLARATGCQGADEALRASLRGYRTTCNVILFHRHVLQQLGYYEGGPDFGEDYDLSIRIADAGFGNVYLDKPLVRYRTWRDASGVRARRKLDQIDGYVHIFDHTLGPAWERRGWSSGALRRQRARLAAAQVADCFAPQYTEQETAELVQAVLRLSSARRVRARLTATRRGAGPLLALGARARARTKTAAKVAAKSTLRAVRGRSRD